MTEASQSSETRPRHPLGFFLAVAVSLALTPAAQGQSTRSRAAARAQFDRAEKQRVALLGKPRGERPLGEYQRVVAAYRRVYLITPHAVEAPRALVAAAELCHEMGRQFDPKYYQAAIDTYQFLIHEYPASRYRQQALLTVGEIQKDDLEQLALAEKSFQEFLKFYPRSEKAHQAREAIADIAQLRQQQRHPEARNDIEEQQEKERRLPQVTRVRAWNAENYTRIVIDVEDQVKFDSARLASPERIYFDLRKAKLSSTLAGKSFEVQSGYLKNIRVAQYQAGVVRVVLDVEKVKDYSAFLLPNPYRLVVDVYGPSPATPAPAVTTAAEKAPEAASTTETLSVPKPPEKTSSASVELTPNEAPRAVGATPLPPKTARPANNVPALAPPTVPRPTQNGQPSLTRALGLKIGRIVIDPGHGGYDTGTIGPTGLMEKDLCLDIALRLGKIIRSRLPGAEVVYTREDDSFVPLENRTALANQAKADLFISIHANSSPDHKTRGVETYYLNFAASGDAMEVASRENALSQSSIHELEDLIKKIARNEKIEESRELAGNVHDALVKHLLRGNRNLKNRGVRKAPFVVLIGADMPSVLSEIAFISNPTEEQILKKPQSRLRVAEGLYRGVASYLQNINSLSYNQPKNTAGAR